jgi:hypothetical protein
VEQEGTEGLSDLGAAHQDFRPMRAAELNQLSFSGRDSPAV